MQSTTTGDRLPIQSFATARHASFGALLPGLRSLAPSPLAATLFVASLAIPAFAQDYPKLKSGLWEMERSADRAAPQPNRMTMCLDDSVQREMFDMGAGAMKGMCSRREFKLSGNRGTGDFVCDLGGSRMHSKSTMQLNGDSGYRMEIRTTYDPPFMGERESLTVLTARRVGACKPSQRPGDMVLPNGQTINVRDVIGGGAGKGGAAGSTKGGTQGGGRPKSERQPG